MKSISELQNCQLRTSLGCKILFVVAAICLIGAASANDSSSEQPQSTGWLAYGDLRGHLRPCGCDPATDMGGVGRIYSQIERERTQSQSSVAVYDLGNNLPEDRSAELFKIKALLEATAAIEPTAILFNRTEWLHQSTVVELLQADNGPAIGSLQARYVLSNDAALLKGEQKNKAASNSKILRRSPIPKLIVKSQNSLVLGYLSPSTLDSTSKQVDSSNNPRQQATVERAQRLLPVSKQLLEQWRQLIAQHQPKNAILLFSGDTDELRQITEANIFSTIIASNSSPPFTDPSPAERQNIRQLLVDESADIWAVPLGGQGILRGGSLRQNEAKSVQQIFAQPKMDKGCRSDLLSSTTCEPDTPLLGITPLNYLTWLDPSYEVKGSLAEILTNYDQAAAQAFKKRANKRLAGLKASPFAGAEACQSCHAAAYKSWQTSGHAQAIATLQKVGQDKNLECVSCHVVGAKDEGGYVDNTASPHLANVQCENCHGPRAAHAQNPTVHPEGWDSERAKEVCVSCHHTPHSSAFDFDQYWPKIKHGHQ